MRISTKRILRFAYKFCLSFLKIIHIFVQIYTRVIYREIKTRII